MDDLKRVQAEIDRELTQLIGGQSIEQALLYARKATIYAVQQNWVAAAEAYDQAAQMAEAAGDTACEALNRYGQACVLHRIPHRADEYRQTVEQVITLSEAINYRTLAAKGHHILGAIRFEEGDWLGAIAAQAEALYFLDVDKEPDLAIQIWRSRATLYILLGNVNNAAEDLNRALSLAQNLDKVDLVLAVQLEISLLENLMHSDRAVDAQKLFGELHQRAKQAGQNQIAGDVHLYQAIAALQSGQPWEAADFAEAARQHALASEDDARITRYYLGGLLLAQAREQLGASSEEQLSHRAAVIEILLVTRKSLEAIVGEDAADLIDPFLRETAKRWGKAGWDTALKAYQLQVGWSQQ